MKLKSKPEASWYFPMVSRPKFADTLQFPADLASLTSANLTELMSRYTQMMVFASQKLSEILVKIIQTETQIRRSKSDMLLARPSLNSLERWRRDAIIEADPVMRALDLQLSRFRSEEVMAQMFVNTYEKLLVVLSRELSRRIAEEPTYRRI